MVKTTKKAVDDFKAFVKKYPKLATVKRDNDLSWQDLFEEWVLYGEDQEFWDEYGIQLKSERKENKKLFNFGSGTDLSKIMSFVNQLDPEDLQEKLTQLDGALTTIQGIIGQFNASDSGSNGTRSTGANQGQGGGGNPYPFPPFGGGQNFGGGPNYNYYNRD